MTSHITPLFFLALCCSEQLFRRAFPHKLYKRICPSQARIDVREWRAEEDSPAMSVAVTRRRPPSDTACTAVSRNC